MLSDLICRTLVPIANSLSTFDSFFSQDDADKDDEDDVSFDSDDDSGESNGEGDGSQRNKKKNNNKRRGKKRKVSASKDDAENVLQDDEKDLTIEEKKKKADDLWAELNDSSSIKSESKPLSITKEIDEKKLVEKVYDFAGEKVVIKETPKAVTR